MAAQSVQPKLVREPAARLGRDGLRLERTLAGLEARLVSREAGRFGGATFLLVWLVFWLAGEAFVLGILIAGGWALATGQPMGDGTTPLEVAPALLAGVFLAGWLAFWTLGGVMAWQEFFRLLWSSDRLIARGDGLEIVQRRGPLAKRFRVPRDTLRGLHRIEAPTSVQAETVDGMVELTRNGTPAEQEQLVAAFIAEMRLPLTDRLPPLLPNGWREVRAPEGGDVLVKDPASRRTAARIMWLITLPLIWAALTVLREAWIKPTLGAVAAILTALAAFALWGAVRLSWTREEWRLEPRQLVRQKRFGSNRREGPVGTGLSLSETTDSDGDRWFTLAVQTDGGGTHPLLRRMHDPTEPRQLGRWLTARTKIPFEDYATPEERARLEAEKAALQAEQLKRLREWFHGWVRALTRFGRRR